MPSLGLTCSNLRSLDPRLLLNSHIEVQLYSYLLVLLLKLICQFDMSNVIIECLCFCVIIF